MQSAGVDVIDDACVILGLSAGVAVNLNGFEGIGVSTCVNDS